MANKRFEASLAHLLQTEGGYNDIKADRGGATNFGISLNFAQGNSRAFDFDQDNDGDVDKNDIKLMTRDEAALIYKVFFWDKAGCDRLPVPIDGIVFDQAVNAGVKTAVILLQQAINATIGKELIVDGDFGKKTEQAALKAIVQKDKFVEVFKAIVVARYKGIVQRNPSQSIFLKGWLNRAAKLGTW